MAVIKWQLNYVSCNFGLKSYLRVWNHACHFRLNCTPLCLIMIINRFYCAKSAIKPTSPVKSSEKLRPTCLLSHMRSWFFLFEILQYIRHQKYMTQRISRPSRSVPRPYYYFFFGVRENVPPPKKRLGPGYRFLYKNTWRLNAIESERFHEYDNRKFILP